MNDSVSWQDDYQTGANDPNTWGRFVWRGVLLALLVHLFLLIGFRYATLREFGAPYYDQLIPRAFQLEALEVDPKLLEDVEIELFEDVPPSKPVPDDTLIQVPEERIAFDEHFEELIATPAAPPSELPVLEDPPRPEPPPTSASALEALQLEADRLVQQDLAELSQQLIQDRPTTAPRPLLELPPLQTTTREEIGIATDLTTEMRDRTASPRVMTPGFSNLDSLLSQTGPLRDGTAPILMPTDLLFAYDSHQLEPGAVSSLTKLGEIIRKNPNSFFIIEGHTDAFGPDDYNLQLSLLRAMAVRDWLVSRMNIDPRQIEVRGLGKTNLLVPGGSVEEQALNRRVEIIIRTRR